MKGISLSDLITGGTPILRDAGIASARLDCELMLAFVLNKDRKFLYMRPHLEIERATAESFYMLVNKRAGGVPLQYITGHQEFMGLDFYVNPDVLIPRPDTEVLVETVLEWLKDYKSGVPTAVDIGTGSGAVAVSLAYYHPGLRAAAVDISPQALEVARINADRNGVSNRVDLINGDLLRPLKGSQVYSSVDVIVSNPPYIPSEELDGLQREVKTEPVVALDGGMDGLDFYRRLTGQAWMFLRRGGLLAMETGWNQADDVAGMIDGTGKYSGTRVVKDLAQRDRVVTAVTV